MEDKKPAPRKPYQPPALKKIRIRLDEVVLAACKTAGGGGLGGASCVMGCAFPGS